MDPREKNIKEFLEECKSIKTRPKKYGLNSWRMWVFNHKNQLHKQFNLEELYSCYDDFVNELAVDDDEIADLYQFEVILDRLGFLE